MNIRSCSLPFSLSGHPKALWGLLLVSICIGGGLCLSSGSAISAQENPPATLPPAAESQTPKDAPQPTAKPEAKSENSEEKKDDKERKKLLEGSFVAAPLPIVSPAIGSGIVPVLGYIFPFQEEGKSKEPSVIGAGGLITDNGTRGHGLCTDLYFKESRYELKAIFADGNINYDLYGVGYVNASKGRKLPLVQTGSFFSSTSCAASLGISTLGPASPTALRSSR